MDTAVLVTLLAVVRWTPDSRTAVRFLADRPVANDLVDANPSAAQGGPDQSQIANKALALDILRVDIGETARVRHINASDLRKACDPRSYVQNSQLPPCLDQIRLRRQARPGTDNAHVASNHIAELWDFVDLEAAKVLTKHGDG